MKRPVVRRTVSRSEFARLGNSRVKSNQRLRDAENMQPWRCAKCNTPVRKGMGDPCKCFQPERRSREMPLEGLTFLIEAPGDRTVGMAITSPASPSLSP